jgi:hypothetical protein
MPHSKTSKGPVTKAPVAFPTRKLTKKAIYSMVMIYENAVTGIRARQFGENLMHELGNAIPWTRDMWDLKMLDLPDVRRAATEAAAIADVVILGLDGRTDLPDSFKAWVEEWAGRLHGQPILIALFNAADNKHLALASTRAFLGTIAETCELTFLHTLGESVVEYRPASDHSH